MKILVISENGRFLGIAQRLVEEGNNVIFTTYNGSNVGQGIIQKAIPQQTLKRTDGSLNENGLEKLIKGIIPELVIVEGNTLQGQITSKIREMRIACFGDALISELLQNPDFHSLTWTKLGILPSEVGGFWNGERFTHIFSLWKDELMIGKNSGLNVNASAIGRPLKEHKELNKLIPLLKKHYHRGFIGINKCQISFIFPLGFFEIWSGSLTSFFNQLTNMVQPLGRTLDMFFGENLITLPPFPYLNYWNTSICKDTPIKLNDENKKHFFLIDGERKGSTFYCAAQSGEVGYVTARGVTIQELSRRVYRTVTGFWIPNLQYRTDFGLRVMNLSSPIKIEKNLSLLPSNLQ